MQTRSTNKQGRIHNDSNDHQMTKRVKISLDDSIRRTSNEFIRIVSLHSFQHIEKAEMIAENISWNWIPAPKLEFLLDYQVFLLCKIVANDLNYRDGNTRLMLSPTVEVDSIWHTHMLNPRAYQQMCTVLGGVVDHCYEGTDDTFSTKAERIEKTQKYAELLTGKRLKSNNKQNNENKENDDDETTSSESSSSLSRESRTNYIRVVNKCICRD
jgi:hypothetical protein